jgi:hypothetical protein
MPSRIVFLVGAPRSGTTYLQNLLGAHPLIVTSQETDLFIRYIAPWHQQWQSQLPSDPQEWERSRHKGLPAVLTEADFDLLAKHAIERVYSATLALKPGASVLLDKVPHNSRYGDVILGYLPDARFIHIIRDGRDVVASQIRASRTWGGNWASAQGASAAAGWRHDVDAGQKLRELTDAYLELRYEDLVSPDAPNLLAAAFAFCGVDASVVNCAEICAAFGLETIPRRTSLVWGGEVIRRLGSVPSEPPGFAGEGGVGAWERDLNLTERASVARQAGPLLETLGYAPSRQWVASSAGVRRIAMTAIECRALARRTRNHIAWRLSRGS